MTQFISTLVGIFQSSGFARFGEPGGYLYAIMICVGCFLLIYENSAFAAAA